MAIPWRCHPRCHLHAAIQWRDKWKPNWCQQSTKWTIFKWQRMNGIGEGKGEQSVIGQLTTRSRSSCTIGLRIIGLLSSSTINESNTGVWLACGWTPVALVARSWSLEVVDGQKLLCSYPPFCSHSQWKWQEKMLHFSTFQLFWIFAQKTIKSGNGLAFLQSFANIHAWSIGHCQYMYRVP